MLKSKHKFRVVKVTSVYTILKRNKHWYMHYAPEFNKMFGVKLWDYYDLTTGFDIVKFDDEVIKSGNSSMGQKVLKVYGKEASNLILELCDTLGREIPK